MSSSNDDLFAFIDGSPSPFHACAAAAARLDASGFAAVDEREAWSEPAARRGYVRRGGTLVAWAIGDGAPAHAPMRMIGAHTDSPNLRVKPRPDTGRAGCRQLGVEVYGGVLLNSWLDRDLGLSGRLVVERGGDHHEVLVRVDRPLLRIPQLAIHLDREIGANGLQLNPQQHLLPIWGVGDREEAAFLAFVAAEAGVDAAAIRGWDLMLHDLTPSTVLGREDDLISAPRLDNLCSSWAALEALVTASDRLTDAAALICLFDHEEIGSTSDRGAGSSILPTVLERLALARGGDREALHRSLAGSACASADMAHATHPNYAERHDPDHPVVLNGGPVLKVNANVRYATDAASSALLEQACRQAGVPLQRFVSRNDMPCGSTIGPITAARLGIRTVDLGAPMLAMHSAREMCGAADPDLYRRALEAWLTPE